MFASSRGKSQNRVIIANNFVRTLFLPLILSFLSFPNGLATSSIHSHTHTHIAEVHNKANMKTWQRNRNNWSIIYCYHVVSISHTYSVRRFSVVAFTGSLVSLIAWLASYIVRSALIIIDFGIMVRRTTNKCTIECACWCDNHTPTLR